jgi:electron-transferring-flavoprotein dehydrogenase
VWDRLHRSRNVRPGFAKGLWAGLANAAVDAFLFRGRAPWTLRHGKADRETLVPASAAPPIDYPKPDGVLTFDRPSSLYLSGTNHRDDQPCHLVLKDREGAPAANLERHAGPEARYCPAGVYEFRDGELEIAAQNCLHCKCCDIKDPTDNIRWIPPEGGGGPLYTEM